MRLSLVSRAGLGFVGWGWSDSGLVLGGRVRLRIARVAQTTTGGGLLASSAQALGFTSAFVALTVVVDLFGQRFTRRARTRRL